MGEEREFSGEMGEEGLPQRGSRLGSLWLQMWAYMGYLSWSKYRFHSLGDLWVS